MNTNSRALTTVVFLALAACWLATTAPAAPAGSASLTASDLRCDLMTDPLGVDSTPPRLSWKLQGDGSRGQHQVASQILVATSRDLLAAGRGDAWDSGRVESAKQLRVPYAGRPPQPAEHAFWRDGDVERD